PSAWRTLAPSGTCDGRNDYSDGWDSLGRCEFIQIEGCRNRPNSIPSAPLSTRACAAWADCSSLIPAAWTQHFWPGRPLRTLGTICSPSYTTPAGVHGD